MNANAVMPSKQQLLGQSKTFEEDSVEIWSCASLPLVGVLILALTSFVGDWGNYDENGFKVGILTSTVLFLMVCMWIGVLNRRVFALESQIASLQMVDGVLNRRVFALESQIASLQMATRQQ
jgi:hypothetical protein